MNNCLNDIAPGRIVRPTCWEEDTFIASYAYTSKGHDAEASVEVVESVNASNRQPTTRSYVF
jgi:hypothetical protein